MTNYPVATLTVAVSAVDVDGDPERKDDRDNEFDERKDGHAEDMGSSIANVSNAALIKRPAMIKPMVKRFKIRDIFIMGSAEPSISMFTFS